MTFVYAERQSQLGRFLGQSLPTLFTVIWLLVGFGLYFSQTWLFQTYYVYGVVPLMVHAAWGAIQVAVFIAMIFFRRRDVRILVPMMLVSAAMFFYGVGLFRRIGDQFAFHFVRGPYDQAVAIAAAPRDRPILIVFPWTDKSKDWRDPTGRLHKADQSLPSGRAIVYDETDAINLINSRTWQKKSPRLGELMNGKPERCIRFADPHYYLCSFS